MEYTKEEIRLLALKMQRGQTEVMSNYLGKAVEKYHKDKAVYDCHNKREV